MAQVAAIQQRQAAARAGNLDAQGQQDLKDLKTDLAVAKGEVVQLRGIHWACFDQCSCRRQGAAANIASPTESKTPHW